VLFLPRRTRPERGIVLFEYRFVKPLTKRTVKATMPSPTLLYVRGWRDGARGGYGDRRPGNWFSPDEIRQFRGEARRWANESQELRNLLREQNIDAKELDEILKRLRELDSERVYKDAAELERLQTFVSEGLKRFEYNLRRKTGDEADRALVNGSDEVPAEFRALVEEYYRSLSKAKPRQ